jgi:hypothetical protein
MDRLARAYPEATAEYVPVLLTGSAVEAMLSTNKADLGKQAAG